MLDSFFVLLILEVFVFWAILTCEIKLFAYLDVNAGIGSLLTWVVFVKSRDFGLSNGKDFNTLVALEFVGVFVQDNDSWLLTDTSLSLLDTTNRVVLLLGAGLTTIGVGFVIIVCAGTKVGCGITGKRLPLATSRVPDDTVPLVFVITKGGFTVDATNGVENKLEFVSTENKIYKIFNY